MALIEKFNIKNGIEIRKIQIGNDMEFWKKENGISYTLSEQQYNRLKSLHVVSKSKIREVLSLERGLGYYSRYDGDEAAKAIAFGDHSLFDGSETKADRVEEIYDEIYHLLQTVRYIEMEDRKVY